KLKDKQQVSGAAGRLCKLIEALPDGDHPRIDALILDLFAGRGELAKVKGADKSGADVVDAVIRRMADGLEPLRVTLAQAHAGLGAGALGLACRAAYGWFPAAKVYEMFSPYVAAKVDERDKGKDAARAKREAVIQALGGGDINVFWTE